MRQRTVILLLLALILAGAGICYYFYNDYKQELAQEALRDSLRRAREEQNARYAAIDQARRDSIARYEKTHSQNVIRKRLDRIIEVEMMSGRNRTEGPNFSKEMNALRKRCLEVAKQTGADSVFRSFSFKGLMGDDVDLHSFDITRVYYVTDTSAYADVLFDIGSDEPDGQTVIFRLRYEEEQWVVDDFTFIYSDGDRVSEKREMNWFIAKWDPNREEQEGDIDL